MIGWRKAGLLLLIVGIGMAPFGCSPMRRPPEPSVKAPLPEPEKTAPVRKVQRPPRSIQVRTDPPPSVSVPSLPEAQVSQPQQTHLVHTVTYRGETLTHIAAWYTGNGGNWERLIEANPGLNPDRMPLGAVILIPQEMVIQRSPLPRTLLPQKPAQNQAPPATRRLDSMERALFGPIDPQEKESSDTGPSITLQPLD
jgi:hypothetical protein